MLFEAVSANCITNGSTMVQVTNNDAKTGGYYVTENKNENK
jgi:hypothetical protein